MGPWGFHLGGMLQPECLVRLATLGRRRTERFVGRPLPIGLLASFFPICSANLM